MSLSIERNNGLDEFEKAVNDEETTAKISKAFAKSDKEIKKDMEKMENQDVIMDVVRKIRSARTLADAKEILIDNAVTLYHTETFASLIQYSLIEGPNPVNLADDPEWVKSFDEEFCGGEIGTEKDPFEGLTDEEIKERLNKVVYLHDGISEEIYIEESGRIYTLNENGNKIYKTVQEPETGFRYLTKDDIGHFSKFPSGSIKSVQDPVQRFMTKFKNGDFNEEFERRRKAEIGYGKPMDLSKEGIAKEVEHFGQTLDFLAEIMPDEFGTEEQESVRKRKKSNGENNSSNK